MPEKKIYYAVLRDEKQRDTLMEWWESLEENKGERAQLRRCEAPLQVLPRRSFIRLSRCLPVQSMYQLMELAAIAGLIAQVQICNTGESFAAQLGRQVHDKPIMSELRFNQLLQCSSLDELFMRSRRAVALLGNEANILSLADYILQWGSEDKGHFVPTAQNRLKFRMANSYYK